MPGHEEKKATGSTVTVELRCGDKFLLGKRPDDDEHYAGYWAFPGGQVHSGESFISAAEREIKEETGLPLTGRLYFVDSYPLEETDRTGIHFVFEVSDDVVRADVHEFSEFRWVSSVAEMAELEPRIAGIDNHAEYSARRRSYSRLLSDALDTLEKFEKETGQPDPTNMEPLREALDRLTWSSKTEAHLTRPDYLNQ
ncbi:MAG: NUDIX hydrolase [Trebonia sp.]